MAAAAAAVDPSLEASFQASCEAVAAQVRYLENSLLDRALLSLLSQ